MNLVNNCELNFYFSFRSLGRHHHRAHDTEYELLVYLVNSYSLLGLLLFVHVQHTCFIDCAWNYISSLGKVCTHSYCILPVLYMANEPYISFISPFCSYDKSIYSFSTWLRYRTEERWSFIENSSLWYLLPVEFYEFHFLFHLFLTDIHKSSLVQIHCVAQASLELLILLLSVFRHLYWTDLVGISSQL